MSTTVFALPWPCDFQVRLKSVHVVQTGEVSSGYMKGIHERSWLKSLHIMSNVKGFAMQDSHPAEHYGLHKSDNGLVTGVYSSFPPIVQQAHVIPLEWQLTSLPEEGENLCITRS